MTHDAYEIMMRATGMDIFESRKPRSTDYKFIMPGIAIGGRDLPVRIVDKQWEISQDEAGHRYTARAHTQLEAIFAIIMERAGHDEHTCVPECGVRDGE